MENLSIDFGHSSVKGVSDNQSIIYPSIISSDVKDIDITEFTDYKPLDFLKVKFEGQEYFIGELARKQSDLCIQNVNHDDMTTHETKTLIMTAAAYLCNSNRINIATDLPVSHYANLKDEMREMLISKNHMITVEIYDFIESRWKTKSFYINNVEIQAQGFYSLMDILLNGEGKLKVNKKDIASALNVIIDIGYYSTDILILNQLEQITRVPTVAIPGMSSAYKMLQKILYDEFGLRKELHDIEPYTRDKQVRIGGKAYSIKEALNHVYSRITGKIITEINNLIDFWPEVDNWFLTGGGSIPLYEDFKTHYQNVTLIDNPQMANSLGGLKWIRRKLNEKQS